nr:DEAD/DEAH box helicase [uncultured Gellertiella sp.]
MTDFLSLGLSRQIVETLTANGYEKPTPIQEQGIPLVLARHDLIGLAQTGTGKTAAFGLPIIEMLIAENKPVEHRSCRTLILAPTRELVNQIAANLKIFVRKTPLKVGVVVGGVSINKQQEQMSRGVDILVSTPGRLLDLISRRALTLSKVTHLVLDEADQMLDLGFIHDLRKISKMVPAKRQTLLFSATMPKAIAELAGAYLTDPKRVEVTPAGKAADKIEQSVIFVGGKNDKTSLLKTSLDANPDGRAIVFLRTKHGAEKLMKHLDSVGYKVASIHGNKSQGQRERALKAFKDGDVKILVATDVAARGIDIPAISHVYNYDLPEVPDAYIHRIGRTARAGRDGLAIAFCAPDEYRLLRDIEKLMGFAITVAGGEAPTGHVPASRDNTRRNNNRGRGEGRPEGRGENRAPRSETRGQRGAGHRGQRPRGGEEAVAAAGPDNDLVSTSDFRPAKKVQGANAGRPGQGRPGQKPGQNRGPRRPGENRGERGRPQQGGGRKRETA